MTRAARAADAEAGWDSIWVFDHFHTVPTPRWKPPSSAGPSRLRWRDTLTGQKLVDGDPQRYRNPALPAKPSRQSTWPVTADSTLGWAPAGTSTNGARMDTGFPEHTRAYGKHSRESAENCSSWTEDYPALPATNYPSTGPLTSRSAGCAEAPHPPPWIGGGEQVTLKLVGAVGDACVGGDGIPCPRPVTGKPTRSLNQAVRPFI